MTRRLFVALPPSQDAIEHLQHFLALVGPPPGTPRQTAESGWHITSIFLGEVDDEQADTFTEQLRELLLGTGPFPLSLRSGGSFGPPQVARTWWAGVGDPQAVLPEIHAACLAAARQARIKVAAESYVPHLTIYRGRPRPSPAWTASWHDYLGPVWTADTVHLMESVRTSTEAFYRTVDRLGLRDYDD